MEDLPDYEDDQEADRLRSVAQEAQRQAVQVALDAEHAREVMEWDAARYAREQAEAEHRELEREQILSDNGFWGEVRNSNFMALPADQVIDAFRRTPYKTNNDLGPPDEPANPYPYGLPYTRLKSLPVPPEEIEARQAFLNQPIPFFVEQAQLWKGKKFLGKGSGGQVGLWEYTGPEGDNVRNRKVVVKQGLIVDDSQADVESEGLLMQSLGRPKSSHLVRLLADPVVIEAGDVMAMESEEWIGKVGRLIMEFCPNSTLFDQIENRACVPLPFEEVTLWRILDCLVDGFTVMEYGAESKYDVLQGQSNIEPFNPWTPCVHFDIKPENIFLGERDMQHSYTPTVKVGDFGLSIQIPTDEPDYGQFHTSLRRRGTIGYLAPEQFTERWDYSNWEDSGVAGLYGQKTNVWGIGTIMYALICLNVEGLTDLDKPYKPANHINGALSKGLTFGRNLGQFTNYSKNLRDLVIECLYEKPGNRPTLLELKARAVEGWMVADRVGPKFEDWQNFMPPDPAVVQNQALEVARRLAALAQLVEPVQPAQAPAPPVTPLASAQPSAHPSAQPSPKTPEAHPKRRGRPRRRRNSKPQASPTNAGGIWKSRLRHEVRQAAAEKKAEEEKRALERDAGRRPKRNRKHVPEPQDHHEKDGPSRTKTAQKAGHMGPAPTGPPPIVHIDLDITDFGSVLDPPWYTITISTLSTVLELKQQIIAGYRVGTLPDEMDLEITSEPFEGVKLDDEDMTLEDYGLVLLYSPYYVTLKVLGDEGG